MKLIIETSELKGIVNKVIKGVGNNKLSLLTQFIGITQKDNKLSFISTDGINTLVVSIPHVNDEDISFCINADKFVQLTNKTVSKQVTLDITGTQLTFIGNGKYKFEIVSEEDGEIVTMPLPTDIVPIEKKGKKKSEPKKEEDIIEVTITGTQLENIIKTNKNSVGISLENPILMGYYIGTEGVMTTNEVTAVINSNLTIAAPLLIRANTIELAKVLGNFNVIAQGNNIKLVGENSIIYSTLLPGIEKYPAVQIGKLLETLLPVQIQLDKNELLAALERLNIFTRDFDDGAVLIKFKDDMITITTLQNDTQVEELKALKSKNNKLGDYKGSMKAQGLIDHLKSIAEDEIQWCIGNGALSVLKINGLKLMQAEFATAKKID